MRPAGRSTSASPGLGDGPALDSFFRAKPDDPGALGDGGSVVAGRLEPVGGKTAAAVTESIGQRMVPFHNRVHPGTADNSREFARHQEIAEALGADLDFATPDPS